MNMVDSSEIRRLIEPQSVAVIGASSQEGSVGKAIFSNILFHGFNGIVYPVNPNRKSILGVRCYPSVQEISDDIDLAVVIVKSELVPDIVEECGKKGVKGLVVISAGFKEIGGRGIELEKRIIEITRSYGMRMIGPNCLGIINTDPLVSLNATFAEGMPRGGNIAFVSQSGALGVAALEYTRAEGIGLSKFFSIGNKADLNENDLLRFLKDDPKTDVILMYIEDLSDHKEFIELAREITGDIPKPKPILAIKSGRTIEGARAVSSHTGSLAGSDETYDSVFAQSGVIRVETMEELFDYALAFSHQPLPRGGKIAILTNGGGAGIMVTDSAIRNGLQMSQLEAKTIQRLKSSLPPAVGLSNPIDILGDATEDRYYIALRALLEDRNVDGVIVISIPQVLTPMKNIAETIADVAPRYQKPVITSFMSLGDIDDALDILERARIPSYRFPETAARAMAKLYNYSIWCHRRRTEVQYFDDVDKGSVREVIDSAISSGRRLLTEPLSNRILEAYRFPTLAAGLAKNEEEAIKIAREIGYPVVLKIVSEDVIHKFDVGGIRLGIKSDDELRETYSSLLSNVEKHIEKARIEGVYVQKMANKGKEIILGAKRDLRFGPLLMVGSGGIYVEVYRDVAFRLAPVRDLGARKMIEEIKAFKILKGFRGEPPSDIDKITECIKRLSQLTLDYPEISEIDINPLFVYEEGKGAAVVDAKIILSLDE